MDSDEAIKSTCYRQWATFTTTITSYKILFWSLVGFHVAISCTLHPENHIILQTIAEKAKVSHVLFEHRYLHELEYNSQ